MREAQYVGCMVGMAIGDALGYPAEFRSLEQIRAILGPRGITDFLPVRSDMWKTGSIVLGTDHPPGTYTDDTQMSIAVANALLEAGEADLDTLMEAMSGEFVAWMESPDNDRAPGATCMTGCEHLQDGIHWSKAGVANSKGCGSAMRTAPIGLYYAQDLDLLEEVARASSLLTHGHDAALEGAVGTALLVALALQKLPPEAMYEELMRRTHGRSADFTKCLEEVPYYLEYPPEVALSKHGLGEAWVAEEAVASALYCFWKSPNDFAQVVITGTNTDGDSDSIACIAGAICGAYVGLENLPTRWVERVENSSLLQSIGRQLYAQRYHKVDRPTR